MKDFLKSELDRNFIFGNNELGYGLIIQNPFDRIIDYTVVTAKRDNNSDIKLKVGNIDAYSANRNICIYSDDLADIIFTQDKETGANIFSYSRSDNDIDYVESVSCKKFKDIDSIVQASTKKTESIEINKSIRSGSFSINPNDTIIQTSIISTKGKLKNTDNIIISILFMNGYNIPIVRVYDNYLHEPYEYCLSALFNSANEYGVILNLAKQDMTEDKDIKIISDTVKSKQDYDLSATIKYSYLDALYNNTLDGYGLKDAEFIDIGEKSYGAYPIIHYDNLITKIHQRVTDGKYETYVDGYWYNGTNLEVVIVDTLISNQNHIEVISLWAKMLSNFKRDEVWSEYLAIIKDDERKNMPYELQYKIEYIDDSRLSDQNIKMILSAVKYTTEVMDINNDNNPKEYKVFNYVDTSGITFKYLYDADEDIFAYFDPCCRVYFKLVYGEYIVPMIEIVSAQIIGLIKPNKVWIRGINGIPVFFDAPKA